MIGYVTLGTNDIAKTRAFYDPLMALLGAKVVKQFSSETRVWYRKGEAALLAIGAPYDGKPATAGNGTMIAIPAEHRQMVHDLHAKAMALGAVNEGDPGLRGAPFFGAYFRDPDGNKICVFTMKAE